MSLEGRERNRVRLLRVKWVLIGLLGLLGLLGALLGLLPYLVDMPGVQAAVAQSAGQALGRPVRFDSLSLSLLPFPSLKLTNLQVAEDPKFGTAPFLAVGTGRLALKIWPLLRGRVDVTELRLEQPRIMLIQDPSAGWNVASLGVTSERPPSARSKSGSAAGGGSFVPLITRMELSAGSLSYEVRSRSGEATTYRLDGLSLRARAAGPGGPIEFEAATRVVPGDLALNVVGGRLTPAVGRPLAESTLAAEIEIRMKDVASLARTLAGPTPQLSGPAQGKLQVSGSLASLTARGGIELSSLTITEHRPRCPEPRVRSLTLDAVRLPLAYMPGRITGSQLSAGLRGGRATLVATLDLSPRPLLRLNDISIQKLPLEPILAGYLCQGYAVTGPLDLTGQLAARPDDVWRTVAGEGKLSVGAGRVTGPEALALLSGVVRIGGALASALHLDLPSGFFESAVDFDSITASYRIADGLVMTRDLVYSSPQLTVTGTGQYSLADRKMDMDLTLKTGRSKIRARVTGPAASPSIQVLTPERLLETGPERLRRLLRGLTEPSR